MCLATTLSERRRSRISVRRLAGLLWGERSARASQPLHLVEQFRRRTCERDFPRGRKQLALPDSCSQSPAARGRPRGLCPASLFPQQVPAQNHRPPLRQSRSVLVLMLRAAAMSSSFAPSRAIIFATRRLSTSGSEPALLDPGELGCVLPILTDREHCRIACTGAALRASLKSSSADLLSP